MRSGFSDPANFDALEASGEIRELIAALEPFGSPDEAVVYTSVNYYLLAVIIERVTGQRWPQVLRRGVLSAPEFESLRIEGLKAGSNVWSNAAELARWGYELYGGSVLSDESLRAMMDFRGEFYGLGAIDFTHPDAEYGYDVESIGHGGQGDLLTVRLVVFPEIGVVVAVQAIAQGFDKIHTIVETMRNAART